MLTVVGEALIDEVVSADGSVVAHPGGSPMNVAIGLARLGHPTQFVGRWGKDDYGEMLSAHLHHNSVLTPAGPDDSPTSIARATLDDTGAAEYEFDLVWDLPGVVEDLSGLLGSTTLLHTGSIAAMLGPGDRDALTIVEQARPAAVISYDPNCRPTIIKDVTVARGAAERFVALSDIVKASDEDLLWLYPDRTIEDSAAAWLELGPSFVVVTRGAAGPYAVFRQGNISVAAPKVAVADTVGAGDSFMSALLSGVVKRGLSGGQNRDRLAALTRGTVEEILREATAAAAITVSRAGANPPDKAELQQYMHNKKYKE